MVGMANRWGKSKLTVIKLSKKEEYLDFELLDTPYSCYVDKDEGKLFIGECGCLEVFDCETLSLTHKFVTMGLVNSIAPFNQIKLLIGQNRG